MIGGFWAFGWDRQMLTIEANKLFVTDMHQNSAARRVLPAIQRQS